jgi:hypothetical protein
MKVTDHPMWSFSLIFEPFPLFSFEFFLEAWQTGATGFYISCNTQENLKLENDGKLKSSTL